MSQTTIILNQRYFGAIQKISDTFLLILCPLPPPCGIWWHCPATPPTWCDVKIFILQKNISFSKLFVVKISKFSTKMDKIMHDTWHFGLPPPSFGDTVGTPTPKVLRILFGWTLIHNPRIFPYNCGSTFFFKIFLKN